MPGASAITNLRSLLTVFTDATRGRLQAATVAGWLYGSGATLVLVSLLLPHDRHLMAAVVLGVVAIAYTTSTIFFTVGKRLPAWSFPPFVGLGSGLIGTLAFAGGSNSAGYAMLFVWAMLYAFYFFTPLHAIVQMVWIVVVSALVQLLLPPGQGNGAIWLMTVGTSVVIGIIIHDLVGRLTQLVGVDSMTGASSRRTWDERLPAALALAGREHIALSIVILDLDHFKVYNDDNGHQAGDVLLRKAAEAWRGVLRGHDLLARYGGEEFAAILIGCSDRLGRETADRLRSVMPGGQTCSAGVATWVPGEDGASLVARADAALYEAKLAGRNRTVPAPAAGAPLSGTRLDQTAQWSDVVVEMIGLERLPMAFQPVVALGDLSVLGYEALARPPRDAQLESVEGFFNTAQRMGLTREVDWLCRTSALEQMRVLPLDSLLFLNVSIARLIDGDLELASMRRLVESSGHSPHRLVLELTERDSISNFDSLARTVQAYRDAGFQFAVDDVGERHSTLEMLAAVVPDYLKIPASYVERSHEPGHRAAIAAAVAFARSSGARVIAEGLASEGAVDFVRALGVEYGQGYQLGRPGTLPLPALPSLVVMG